MGCLSFSSGLVSPWLATDICYNTSLLPASLSSVSSTSAHWQSRTLFRWMPHFLNSLAAAHTPTVPSSWYGLWPSLLGSRLVPCCQWDQQAQHFLPLHNPLAPQKKTTAVSEGHEGCQFIHTRHYLSLWSDIPGKLGAEQHGYRLAPIQLSRLDFLFFSDAPRQFKGLYGTFKPLQSHLIKSHNLPLLNILQL